MDDDRSTCTRIPCAAPSCARGIGIEAWRKRFGDLDVETAEYVCQQHWSRIPQVMRRVYARARRRDRRMGAHLASTDRLWRRIMTEIGNRETEEAIGPEMRYEATVQGFPDMDGRDDEIVIRQEKDRT